LFDLIADSTNPKSLYATSDVKYPIYLVTSSGTTYFHLLREVQKPQACQIGPNRFIVTWWAPFYDTYDIATLGYDDAADKMIRTSNTSRPATTYKRVMLGSFMTFMRGTYKWTITGTAYNIPNVLIPVFTKPAVIFTVETNNDSVAGALTVVQATADGSAGLVTAKSITLKTDPALSPNFIQDTTTQTLKYFKL
jgi:hypothetical protein